MDGRKMAIVPFKLWEDLKRWKEEQIQKPRLPPNPNVSATASLQRDLSSVCGVFCEFVTFPLVSWVRCGT